MLQFVTLLSYFVAAANSEFLLRERVKFALEQALKAQRGNRDITLLFL
jgi:hypothetical protein